MMPMLQTIIRSINSALLLFILALFALLVLRALIKKIDLFGAPPINRFVFLLGKLANFGCWGVFIFFTVYSYFQPYEPFWPAAALSSLCLIPAALLICFSFRRLGNLNRFGLPGGKTALVKKGLYARSRNPMYLGFSLLNIASALYVPRLYNLLPALAGIVIHHFIVMGEERHLKRTFKAKWDEYERTVRRYF